MSQKDPYQILGVTKQASADEIKRAYRQLAKKYHPDRNPNDKAAEQRFKEIQAAYEVLGDAKRRAEYDRFGAGGPAPEYQRWTHAGQPSGVHVSGVDFDFSDAGDLSSIFEQFFRRGAARRPAQQQRRRNGRGTATIEPEVPAIADLEHIVDLSFEEAARGSTREVALRFPQDGRTERIDVRIPAGVEHGQRIRVRGRGHIGEAARGDLIIKVRVSPHAYFRREGLDVLLDLPLTMPEAALGTRVDIPTLSGPTRLTVPAGASSGAKLRLREKGIHEPRSGRTGDMYAVVRIVAPKSLPDEVRGLLEQHAGDFGPDPRRDLGWRV